MLDDFASNFLSFKVLDQLKGAQTNEVEMGEVNEALDEDNDKASLDEKSQEKHGDIEETDFDAISMDSVDSTVVGSDGSDIEPEVEGSDKNFSQRKYLR